MTLRVFVVAALFAPVVLPAQSLARRVSSVGDGPVAFTFAAKRGVCGNGSTYLEDGYGGTRTVEGDFSNYSSSRGEWRRGRCEPGPVRVVASVVKGEVVRLRTYVGPPTADAREIRALGDVAVRDAVDYLMELAQSGVGRTSDEAFLGIMLADSTTPWPFLFRMARDDGRSKKARKQATFWLSKGASAKLGLAENETPDDEVRATAVFALSQQPREQAIPELIAVARSGKYPGARAQALFWLGQSGDQRAIALFEEILLGR
jgi:hypothetical protein